MKSNAEVQHGIGEIEDFIFRALGAAFPSIPWEAFVTLDYDEESSAFYGTAIDSEKRLYTIYMNEDDKNPLIQRAVVPDQPQQSAPDPAPTGTPL